MKKDPRRFKQPRGKVQRIEATFPEKKVSFILRNWIPEIIQSLTFRRKTKKKGAARTARTERFEMSHRANNAI